MADGLPDIEGRAITQAGTIRNAGAVEAEVVSMFGKVATAARQIGAAIEPYEIERGKRAAIRQFVENEKAGRGFGQVTKRSGFLGLQTAGDVAYNNMMETLYLQKTKFALQEKAQEIANDPQSFGDVDAFDRKFGEFVGGMGSQIDPDFAEEFFIEAQSVQQSTRLKIAQRKQENDIAEARQTMDTQLSALEDEILAAMLAGGPAAANREDVQKKRQEYANLLNIKSNNPLYQYSDIQRDRDIRNFQVRIAATALTPLLRDVYNEKGYAEALKWSDEEVAALGLPPGETASIRNALRQEVNLLQQTANAFEAQRQAQEAAERKRREEIADEMHRRVIDLLFDPNATEDQIQAALGSARNFLTPSEYGTLVARANDRGRDMPVSTFVGYQIMADRGEMTVDQIRDLNVSPSQAEDLIGRVQRFSGVAATAGRDTIKALFSKADYLSAGQWGEGQSLRVRQQEAFDQFAAWLREQEVAGKVVRPAEAIAEAQAIAARLGQYEAVAAGSRFIKVDINGRLTPESVNAARTALKDAIASKSISAEEARREMARIKLVEEGLAYGR